MKVTVALPVPLRRAFDYVIEAEDAIEPPVGIRVRVPFGSRTLIGFVIGVSPLDGS